MAIRNHSQGLFKEGDTFVIRGLKNENCHKCRNGILIDVGQLGNIQYMGKMVQCHNGHGIPYLSDGVSWFSEYCFKPLDELVNISELTEVLNEPIFK